VPQSVELDLADLRPLERILVALRQLGPAERLAGIGIGENEVFVPLPRRALEVAFQLAGKGVTERDRRLERLDLGVPNWPRT
jgi:hypothetical protein